MISLIVCSKHQDIDEKLKNNIKETIGVEYELVVIDNSNNSYSIFEAYNEGIKRAKFDYLCFMHEDIWYHSPEWGEKVINHLSDKETGLIGLAGSFYLNEIPGPWFKSKPYVKNLVQKHQHKNSVNYTLDKNYQVLCLDGFWICSRKDVFEKITFDTLTFDGFHCYDLDICLQAFNAGYKSYVISDILVEHYSTGSLNLQWIDSSIKLYKKWESIMPATVSPQIKKRKFAETKAFRDLLYAMYRNDYKGDKKAILKRAHKILGFNIYTAYFLFFIKVLTKKKK